MAQFVYDTFTGTSNTILSSHVGEVGATWVLSVANASGDLRISNANRCRANVAGAAASLFYASGVSRTADYSVTSAMYTVSTPVSGFAGVAGRVVIASGDCYFAIYNFGTGNWELWKSISGTGTQLGSGFSQSLSVGVSYTLRLAMFGATISLLVDGVSRVSVTDSALSAVGRVGAIGYGAWSDSIGLHNSDINALEAFTLHTVGDSVTAGLNASDAAHRWANLVNVSLDGVLSNNAVSATQLVDETSDSQNANRNQIYLGTSIPIVDVWAMELGYNDMRYFGTDSNGIETFKRLLRSAVAWVSRIATDCYQMSNGAWTMVGSWSSLTINGLATKYSSTVNDTASISVTGTAVTVAYISHFGLGDGGTFEVKIDGNIVAASIDTDFGSSSGYGGGSPTQYAPMALRYGGLSAGAHTVLITVKSAAVVQLAFVTGNGEASVPDVRVGGPLKMNVTGYASNSPYNAGSDAAVTAFENTVKSVLADALTDGRLAKWADINAYYNISEVDTDNVHPADAGHAAIAQAFLNAAVTTGGSVPVITNCCRQRRQQ